MGVRIVVWPVVVVSVLVGLVGLVVPASAAAVSPSVDPVQVIGQGPGDHVDAVGRDFGPDADVVVTLDDGAASEPLGTGHTDGNGLVHTPSGAAMPLTATPGVTYRVTMTQAGGRSATSPPFTISPPSADLPTTLQPGRPAGAPAPGYGITLVGLSTGPDAGRTVSIDGTAVTSVDFGSGAGAGVTFTVPAALPVGDHRLTFTQTGATPFTVSGTATVSSPTVTVTSRVAPTMRYGIPVSITGLGWNGAEATVVGAAGDHHTAQVGGPVTAPGPYERWLAVSGLSVGSATLTVVNRDGGLTARATFVVDPASVTGPAVLGPDHRIVTAMSENELVMQTDGNLVFDNPFVRTYWNTHTAGHPGAHLAVQSDGNVVVYDANGRALWNAGTAGIGKGARLGFDPNGDVGIYTASGRRAFAAYAFPPPETGVLTANHYLFTGQFLTSATSSAADPNVWFTVQRDGNVVVSTARGPRWSTGTSGHPGTYLVLQADGNLVVHAANGAVLWANHAHVAGARLVAQGDGNIVESAPNGTAVWSTRTALF